jgi:polysaccharide export outer membrane protein
MNSATKLILLFISLSVLFSSCLINQDFMFKTPEGFTYQTPVLDSSSEDYKISPNTSISVTILSRSGSAIIEATTGGGDNFRLNNLNNNNTFVIDNNGMVELPLIGNHNLSGMSILEAQNYIEKELLKFIVDPFCIVKVTNRYCIYFNGSGSQASVIGLNQFNTSLIDVIAMGGGISERGNSSKVKVIRKVNGQQNVFLFDLSTIDAARFTNFAIQTEDIIYVEPMPRYSTELLSLVTPVISLLSSTVLFVTLISRL